MARSSYVRILNFPKGFLWGAATAAHQVEGDNKNSDWWDFEQKGRGEEPSGKACNQYELYKSDFELSKKLHHNAYRLSLEWARLQPSPEGFSKKETKHYREVLQFLKHLGFKTFVTVHHFTNPLWFAKLGGFSKKENLNYFENYVRFCSQNFGDLTDFWITINEPNLYVGLAYLSGLFPPEEISLKKALLVFLNLTKVHNRAYQILHDELPAAKVGSATHQLFFRPERKKILDKICVKISNFIFNDLFYLFTAKKHDFIGINYYYTNNISWRKIKKIWSLNKKEMKKETLNLFMNSKSLLGERLNEGIFHAVLRTAQKYKKPIYITENGVAGVRDKERKKFIKKNLYYLHQAMQKGADVRGYLYWSLIDNFEWIFGFKPKFGLVKVDFRTMERNARPSAYYYAKICQTNTLRI